MTPSALTPRGSTAAWLRLRRHLAEIMDAHRAAGADVICRICNLPILPGQPWDAGHATPRCHGGDDTNVQPEHAHCNRAKDANTRRIATYTHPDFFETGVANSPRALSVFGAEPWQRDW
jgi:hypothetical protein